MVEVLEPADEYCDLPCCPDTGGRCMVKQCPTCTEREEIYTCGGDLGRISVFYNFSVPVTIGLNIQLRNIAGDNIAIHYDSSALPQPPAVTYAVNNTDNAAELDAMATSAITGTTTGTTTKTSASFESTKTYTSITGAAVNITKYKNLNVFEVSSSSKVIQITVSAV